MVPPSFDGPLAQDPFWTTYDVLAIVAMIFTPPLLNTYAPAIARGLRFSRIIRLFRRLKVLFFSADFSHCLLPPSPAAPLFFVLVFPSWRPLPSLLQLPGPLITDGCAQKQHSSDAEHYSAAHSAAVCFCCAGNAAVCLH